MVTSIRKSLAAWEQRSNRASSVLGGLTAIVVGVAGMIGGATTLLNAISPEKRPEQDQS